MKTNWKITAAILAMAGAVSAHADADWSLAMRLYGDAKARRVGDLLTVIITEESSVKRDAQETTGKTYDFSGDASFGRPRVDARPVSWTNFSIPAWKIQAGRTFAGKGAMENRDEFSAAITVRVTELLPNGNLLIEGRRTVVVRNETIQYVLTGTVRPQDIDKANTVKSTSIADAAIRYETTGSIANSQKKGIIPVLVDWINPF